MSEHERNITVWYGRLEDAEQFMDLRYWLAQSNDASLPRRGIWLLRRAPLKEKT